MLQPNSAPDISLRDRLRLDRGRRVAGLVLALLVEGLLLLLLLTLGFADKPKGVERDITIVNLVPSETLEKAAEPPSPSQAEQAEEQRAEEPVPPEPPATPQPPPLEPIQPKAAPPLPPAVMPRPAPPPPPAPAPSPARRSSPSGAVYGPPDTRRSSSRDSQQVGVAPNGEPLYAAAWYREPTDDELRDYLSTARGPGWGLIACRTVPGFRVEDCVALEEYPHGSQINRAVLAAAWQFKVRPPQRGGVPQVGSWVRIRIDYNIRRR